MPPTANPESARRFEAFVLPHLRSAYNVARWLTHNDHDAEDIRQEACLRALRYFDGFRGADARTWLLSIVRNTFYTRRSRNSGPAAQSNAYDEAHELETAAEAGPEAMLAQKALRSLSPEYREVVVLRELEDLSYREIADILGVPIGTVMSRLSRGRRIRAASPSAGGEAGWPILRWRPAWSRWRSAPAGISANRTTAATRTACPEQYWTATSVRCSSTTSPTCARPTSTP